MLVADVMTPRVIGIEENADLLAAVEILLRSNASELFVFNARKALVGVVSEGDLLRRAELKSQRRSPRWLASLLSAGSLALSFVHSHGRRVSEVMTRDVVSIAADADLSVAADVMVRRGLQRLPVMRTGEAIGVLSRSGVVRALYLALPQETAANSDTGPGSPRSTSVQMSR